MSLCIIKYTYTRYVGVDIENILGDYSSMWRKSLGSFNHKCQSLELYLICQTIWTSCSAKGRKYLLRNGYPKTCHQHPAWLSNGWISIGNLYPELRWHEIQKRHAYPKPWWNHKANGKSGMRKLKIHKTISKRNLNNQEGKDSEGIRIPELRPQIDFHDF